MRWPAWPWQNVSRLGAADVVVASRPTRSPPARRAVRRPDRPADPGAGRDGRGQPAGVLHRRHRCRAPARGRGRRTGRGHPPARDHRPRPAADVDPAVAELPDVSLFGLARLAEEVNEGEGATDVAAVQEIVTEEISAFLAARRSATVTPTVVALRTMATGIVDGEMERLFTRLPELDPAVRTEVEHAVRRVADKLLHQPTVRVKQLANETGAVSYAAALAELFSLDPEAVEAVTRAEGIR